MAESDRIAETLTGDEALLSELLRGVSIVGAAQAAGYSEATARRRLRDEGFRRRLSEGRRELMGAVAAQLAGSAELGYAVLRKIALDDGAPPSVRVKAAVELIGIARAVGEQVDMVEELLARVAQLEEEIGPRKVRAA